MDKNRYKFKRNPSSLSEERIARHQDFDALMEQFQQSKRKPGIVRALYWLAPLTAAAGILGWMFLNNGLVQDDYPVQEKAYFAAQPFVNPPIPKLQAKLVSQKLNAFEGGVFEYENGSKVIVPKSAFVDDQGAVIGGEVEIRYREYHDFVDFFLSGIPMHYDSAGTRYQLESAGMMELYAEQNGKRLNVAPGKAIQVELNGEVLVPADNANELPDFNVYRLDIQEKNWSFEGIDQLEWADKLSDVLPSAKNATANYEREKLSIAAERKTALTALANSLPQPTAPVKPARANDNDITFELAFNAFDDPSLAGLKEKYEGALWKVNLQRSPDFTPELAEQVQWENMSLKKINDGDFELTLFSSGNSIEVSVSPILTGEAFLNAQSDYTKALTAYKTALEDWNKEMAEKTASLDRKYDALVLAAKNEMEDAKNDLANSKTKMLKRKVVNRFTANRLGIWNCDFPIKPFNKGVRGDFIDENKNKIEKHTGYLVDKNRNTLSRFYATDGAQVEYNEQSQSLMWVVTEDERIAIFKPENFQQIKKDDGSYTFVMDRIEKELQSEQELRRILEF